MMHLGLKKGPLCPHNPMSILENPALW